MRGLLVGLAFLLCTAAANAQWELDIDALPEEAAPVCVPSAPGKLFWSQQHLDTGWLVKNGTTANVNRYYTRVNGRLVDVGATLGIVALYPVPWCHMNLDATLSLAHYYCSEHIWDEFIPQPDMIAHPALTCNIAPTTYDLSTVECHFNQLLVGADTMRWGLDGLPALKKMRFVFSAGIRPGRATSDSIVKEPCATCRYAPSQPPTASRRLADGASGAEGPNVNTADGGLVVTAR